MAVMLRKRVIAAWRLYGIRLSPWVTNQVEGYVPKVQRNGSDSGADARKSRRKKEQ